MSDRQRGYVYMLYHQSSKTYKTGSTRNPEQRWSTIRSGIPGDVQPVFMADVPHYKAWERHMLGCYAEKCVNGEWFKLTEFDIANICSEWAYVSRTM